jgi:hypothetical protein
MSDLQPGAIQESGPQPALSLEGTGLSGCPCSICGKGMALRDARDYGLPNDLPRRVVRVVWWECLCGQRQVIAKNVLL